MAKKKNINGADKKAQEREGVRKALEALGDKADVHELHEWIKSNHGLTVDNKIIGIHKFHILPKDPSKGRPGRKPKKKGKGKAASNGAPAKAAAPRSSISFDDLKTLQQLVGRYGRVTLKDLIGVVG
jgi:hypothetical protein